MDPRPFFPLQAKKFEAETFSPLNGQPAMPRQWSVTVKRNF